MPSFLNVTHLVVTYGYIGLFLTILIESGVFFALPGDSLLFSAGLLAPVAHFNLFWLTSIVIVAATLGGEIGYWIGTVLERLHRYQFFRKLFSPKRLDEAHHFFERRGSLAVLLGRFVPVARTFVPIAAGVARMKRSVFSRYNFFGAVLWPVVFIFSGYFLGKTFPGIDRYLTYIIVAVVIVSILPGAYEWWRHRR